jgi:formylglycine-generating enzyme required for sulfatase activity
MGYFSRLVSLIRSFFSGPADSGPAEPDPADSGPAEPDPADSGPAEPQWVPFDVWAEVIEAEVDPAVVTDATLRDAIEATGLPWRVRDKGTNIEMLLIPPGEFVMGKSRGDDEAREDELPAHEVKLTKAFYLGRYEVTQKQFAAIANVNPSNSAKFVVPTVEALMEDGATRSEAEAEVRAWRGGVPPASDAKGKEWPVESVSWVDCAAFCKKAGFRLPTEAEWEYACRAGTRAPRYGELDEIAWCEENSNDETHAVGTKLANALGLHDMIGNVWEWVNDWYDGDYYSTSPSVNPQGPSSGSSRVLRGGSCLNDSCNCRASFRINYYPDDSYYAIGFRVARTP